MNSLWGGQLGASESCVYWTASVNGRIFLQSGCLADSRWVWLILHAALRLRYCLLLGLNDWLLRFPAIHFLQISAAIILLTELVLEWIIDYESWFVDINWFWRLSTHCIVHKSWITLRMKDTKLLNLFLAWWSRDLMWYRIFDAGSFVRVLLGSWTLRLRGLSSCLVCDILGVTTDWFTTLIRDDTRVSDLFVVHQLFVFTEKPLFKVVVALLIATLRLSLLTGVNSMLQDVWSCHLALISGYHFIVLGAAPKLRAMRAKVCLWLTLYVDILKARIVSAFVYRLQVAGLAAVKVNQTRRWLLHFNVSNLVVHRKVMVLVLHTRSGFYLATEVPLLLDTTWLRPDWFFLGCCFGGVFIAVVLLIILRRQIVLLAVSGCCAVATDTMRELWLRRLMTGRNRDVLFFSIFTRVITLF